MRQSRGRDNTHRFSFPARALGDRLAGRLRRHYLPWMMTDAAMYGPATRFLRAGNRIDRTRRRVLAAAMALPVAGLAWPASADAVAMGPGTRQMLAERLAPQERQSGKHLSRARPADRKWRTSTSSWPRSIRRG